MKKRNKMSLTLNKKSISNLKKTTLNGGIDSLDSQVSCYNTCNIHCQIDPDPDPIPLPIKPVVSVLYWQCPR